MKIGGKNSNFRYDGKYKNELKCDIPVLVITFHGAYGEEKIENFEDILERSPVKVYKINATKLGVCNLLTEKLSNSVPSLIKKGRKNNCNTMIKYLRQSLFNLDHKKSILGNYPLNRKSRINKGATDVVEAAKDLVSIGDLDGKTYIEAISNSYSISNWNKWDLFVDKFYSIGKEDIQNSNKNRYDDRILLYTPNQEKPKDLVPSWRCMPKTRKAKNMPRLGIPSTPADRAMLRHRDEIYFTLSDILWKLRVEEKIHEVLIIDLACASINDLREDSCEESPRPAISPRLVRRLARYPHGGKGKTRKYKTNKIKNLNKTKKFRE
tara:strand:+ start:390 stop:1358 length:969 start_codon:yes stop_codon:yes gene_type:complete